MKKRSIVADVADYRATTQKESNVLLGNGLRNGTFAAQVRAKEITWGVNEGSGAHPTDPLKIPKIGGTRPDLPMDTDEIFIVLGPPKVQPIPHVMMEAKYHRFWRAVTPAERVRILIRLNIKAIKQNLFNKIYAYIKSHPPLDLLTKKPIPLTEEEIVYAANKLADALIMATDEFLKKFNWASPRQGMSGVLSALLRLPKWESWDAEADVFNPWCEVHARENLTAIYEALKVDPVLSKIFRFTGAQWRREEDQEAAPDGFRRQVQHNVVLIYTPGHKPTDTGDPEIFRENIDKKSPLIVDSWIDLFPSLFTPQEHFDQGLPKLTSEGIRAK